VIALARWFGAQPKPQRGLLFVAFAGEELGLLGSSFYVNHPALPLQKAVLMINMDMIGRIRDRKVLVSGATNGSAHRKTLQSLGEQYDLALDLDDSGVYGSSDHTSFKTKLVPILFFFSGLHGDYHRPTDTWEKIEAPGAAKLLNLLSEFISTVASRPVAPRLAESQDPARTEAAAGGSSH
jgi:Zn-dependent M28 family amino/carboxypeptidase